MYWRLKVKCPKCGLHFVLCTEHPKERRKADIFCPECGEAGQKTIWLEEASGFIFQEVPGNAELKEVK